MIKKLTVKKFKRFSNATFEFQPQGVTILAGNNNSGKSSVLHALAIWEFCKLYLINQKGRGALKHGGMKSGVGININDFSPINIPGLKYLWTNLKPGSGYNLKLKCYWDGWFHDDNNARVEKEFYLEFSLGLNNERLLIKNSSSNLVSQALHRIPTLAYLPPFAGISDLETWHSAANRRRLIGQGLAGSVLRNMILDLYQKSTENRRVAQGNLQRLRGEALQKYKLSDPFHTLNRTLVDTFECELVPQDFDLTFHSYIRVDLVKGKKNVSGTFDRFTRFNKRDIMVEGSGFLQWLSVYTLALDDSVDVLLLDEPDAHLHTSLQTHLLSRLEKIALDSGKQVLMASHSTDIIRGVDHQRLFRVTNSGGDYLSQDVAKIDLLAGLGTDYHPQLFALQKHKRVLFVENESDVRTLKQWAATLNMPWPENLVSWPTYGKHKERKHLVLELQKTIPELKGISLQDRDDDPFQTTRADLSDSNTPHLTDGNGNSILKNLKWRRREIENYILLPSAIARVKDNVSVEAVNQRIATDFSLIVPESEFTNSEENDRLHPLFMVDAKRALGIIDFHFGIQKEEIVSAMAVNEIPDDISTLLNEITALCS